MPPESPELYRIIMSGAVSQRILRLQGRARIRGTLGILLDDLRHIDHQLQTAPLTWGEAIYNLRDQPVVMCVGFRNRLMVRYGVLESQRTVFIRGFYPLPGYPLFPFD